MAKAYVKPKEMTELVNTPSWMDKGLASQNEVKEEERRLGAYGMLGSLAEDHDSIEEEEEEEEDGDQLRFGVPHPLSYKSASVKSTVT